MDSLKKFKNLLKSKYLFHLHTNYTDGASTVEDYCLWASENGYSHLVFTEHVRKELSYDFEGFLSDIRDAGRRFVNLNIRAGVEAKLLPGGGLDIPQEILPDIEVICFACHSFPSDLDLYASSFRKLFSDTRWKNHVRIWVHPGYFFKRLGIMEAGLSLLNELADYAIKEGIFVEHNIRHKLPPESVLKNIPKHSIITGLDAHSVEDLGKLT